MSLHTLLCLLPLLMNLPYCVHGFGIRLMEVTETERSQIVCALALLQKYFQCGESLSGSVVSMSFTSASLHIQQDLLNAIHAQTDIPWTVVVRNPHQKKVGFSTTMILHEKPQSYFLVIENIEDGDLENAFEDWKRNINWNPLAQFVVYLASIEETDEEMTELMIEILLNFMNRKLYNVNVIGRNEENGLYYGKTVFPYHPDNNCGNRVIAVETLDICDYQENENPIHFDEDEEEDEAADADEDGFMDDDNGGGDEHNSAENEENGKESGDCDKNDNEDYAENAGKEDNVEDDKSEGGNSERDNVGSERDVNSNSAENSVQNDADVKQDEERNEVDREEYAADEEETNRARDSDDKSDETRKKFGKQSEREETNILDKYINNRGGVDKENFITRSKEGNKEENEYDQSETKFDNINEALIAAKRAEIKRESQSTQYAQPIRRRKLKSKQNSNTQRVRQKRTIQSRQKLIGSIQDGAVKQQVHLQELYRGLFPDKFPKDLSGCPVVAAYRPWEPYIFKENSGVSANGKPTVEKSAVDSTTADTESEQPVAYDTLDDENAVATDNYNDMDIVAGSETDAAYSYNDVETTDVDTSGMSVETTTKLNGIEYQLVQTIGERLHITIEFQAENTNLYHLFQQLIDGDIEMIIGGIDEDPIISNFVSSSIPYHQDDLTWCVARAKQKYNLFNFLQSFRLNTWIFILGFIFVCSLNIFIAQKVLNTRLIHFGCYLASLVRILGIILSQSTQLVRLPISLHITFGSAFFLAFMFVNVYQSFLVSDLTTPRSLYQISHLDEIYRHRMTVTGSVENVRHLNKDGKIFKYIREKFQMCYNIVDCLNHAATDDERLAVAVSRQYFLYNPHIKRDQLYCFDRNENLYIYLVTMLLPKKFHLLHKINPVIQHIIESGHMQKWERELDMKRRIREEIERAQKVHVKSLTIIQIGGSFALHSILSALTLIIFLLEYCTQWLVVKRRTRLRLFRMLHRKFQSK